jgi:hypothetical protein
MIRGFLKSTVFLFEIDEDQGTVGEIVDNFLIKISCFQQSNQ